MSKKMKFTEDKYYNRDVIYVAGKVYDIPENMVDRWLKRGGEIVVEVEPVAVVHAEPEKPAPVPPVTPPAPKFRTQGSKQFKK